VKRFVLSVMAPLALAACGGGGGIYGMAAQSPKPTAPAGGATVQVTGSRLGTILTDGRGETLYYDALDGEGRSVCTGQCAASWRPLAPMASAGLTGTGLSGKLGTITRPDGGIQVTYNDRPLYTFVGDGKPGDTNGQGVAGVWFVATPGLNDPDAAPAAMPASPPPAAPPATRASTPAPSFNDHDADNGGAPSDGDGNG